MFGAKHECGDLELVCIVSVTYCSDMCLQRLLHTADACGAAGAVINLGLSWRVS